MDKKTEALKLALDALNEVTGWQWAGPMRVMDEVEDAIIAVRAALADQPAQQEAVGEVYRHGRDSHGREWHGIHWYDANVDVPHGTKLYISLQPSKPWVGLTEKEKREARFAVSPRPVAMTMSEWTEAVQDATEAKLKEKNT